MYFDDVVSLLAMDGHGAYVWSAYAIGLLVLLFNVVSPLLTKRRLIRQIKRQMLVKQGLGKSVTEKKKTTTSGQLDRVN